MSQSDSFIEEVTEEVRRDRLYGLARRYGWIVGLGLVLVVGGAAFLEWQKSRARAAAEGLGDTIFAAMESGTPQSRVAALSDVTADGVAAALVAMLAAAELAASDPIAAADRLESVIENTELPRIYRDLATLKLVMLADNPMFSDDKIAALEPLVTPGAPFRLMAMEQLALLHMDNGAITAALDLLQPMMVDAEASPAQRQRAQQLVIVLDGDLEGA